MPKLIKLPITAGTAMASTWDWALEEMRKVYEAEEPSPERVCVVPEADLPEGTVIGTLTSAREGASILNHPSVLEDMLYRVKDELPDLIDIARQTGELTYQKATAEQDAADKLVELLLEHFPELV